MATLNLTFATSASATGGYKIKYRPAGTLSTYTEVTAATSPATITGLSGFAYEGSILSMCGSGLESIQSTFYAAALLPCGGTVTDTHTQTLSSEYYYPTYDFKGDNTYGKIGRVLIDTSSWVAGNNIINTFTVSNRPAAWILYKNGSQTAQSGYVGTASYSGPWGALLNNPGPVVSTIAPASHNNAAYVSAAGATSTTTNNITLVTVSSTTGLSQGMVVRVTGGTGVFPVGTRVMKVDSSTTFTVDRAPTTALSASAVVTAADGWEFQFIVGPPNPSNPQSCTWTMATTCSATTTTTTTTTALGTTRYYRLRICPSGSTTDYYTTTVISNSGQRVLSGGGNYYVYQGQYYDLATPPSNYIGTVTIQSGQFGCP